MTTIRNIWGGPLDITPAADEDEQPGPHRSAPTPEEEVKQRWLRQPPEGGRQKAKTRNGCCGCGGTIPNGRLVKFALMAVGFIGFVTIVSLAATGVFGRRHVTPPVVDNYTIALHRALQFFDAQRSGRLPEGNNVTWRGNSCLEDEPAGGYYDAGNAIKFTFPTSFAMTLLSWSVIEYSAKYQAAGELDHVKSIIKWGTDYLLHTFNNSPNTSSNNSSSHSSIDHIVAQVGGEKDNHCWVRPEDIDYSRPVLPCHTCPALAAETAAALASASIVFKLDQPHYSASLLNASQSLFRFATGGGQGLDYAGGSDPGSSSYNSTGFWDEFIWGGAWLYCATGNISYLDLVTSPKLLAWQKDEKPHPFWRGEERGVFSWNNKHLGAQLLLTRIRMFLTDSYPYETLLHKYHQSLDQIICSYMPYSPSSFTRTNGGLIQLYGRQPRPLHYAVNAAFLAALYGDYIASSGAQGWMCGAGSPVADLRNFAMTQVNYILGNNPQGMSYVVGYGEKYPQHVHHRGASIPDDGVKYGCEQGWKWRDSPRPDPNTVVGAMVGGPYGSDVYEFKDIRGNYSYTEPTIVGNAGLVASLVALSSAAPVGGRTGNQRSSKVDINTMFSAVPPLYKH